MEVAPYIGTKPVESLAVKVFPKGDSRYIMYDCDAESYGYESGLVAKTLFECHESSRAVDLVVNPVEGNFENMPAVRSYRFEVRLDRKPSKVIVDGVKCKDWTWEEGVLMIKVPTVSVLERLSVSISL